MLAKSKKYKTLRYFSRSKEKKVSNDFGLAAKVISEMFSIADSYFYSNRPYVVYGETIMANENRYNYDTIALFL